MKTKKRHFKYFKKQCQRWIDFFGLKGWEIHFQHEHQEDSMATVWYSLEGRCLVFTLSTDTGGVKPSKKNISRWAFHEVCEVLVGRLEALAKDRFVTDKEIFEEVHNIIRMLENSVWERMR